jgi:hypothetical protein|tara:strand:- start:239 stop:1225 length:987 start_codon:yes stop_codon:yes gene_type:complete
MSEVNNIPVITTDNTSNIPQIQVNGTGIPLIQGNSINNIDVYSGRIRPIANNNVADVRVWMVNPPQALPQAVPVTVIAGTPVVNMPGCVKVHKENVKQRSRNKMLVDDDPKGNTVLCDAGAPYFEPANYDARELTWQTVYGEPEEQPSGVNTGDTGDLAPPETPEPPPQDAEYKDPDCPGPTAPRIGDVAQNKKEKVSGFELQEDPNNLNQKICVTLYEDIGIVEAYLPAPQVVTTTAVIATVATSSALLAKPLADLLMKVVKPLVKKVMTKVNAILGKSPYRPTQSELKTNLYREKKGLLAIPFAKNHQKKMKAQKKSEKNQKKTQN